MVPAHFEIVPQLPRLTSGKVDRNALRSLPLSADRRQRPRRSQSAGRRGRRRCTPRSENCFPGRIAAGRRFLRRPGRAFAVGGALVSMLRSPAGVCELSVQDVYRQRRLEAIAAAMRRKRSGSSPAAAPPPRVAVPWRRRVLCGLAQAVVIPLLMVLHIADWLAPFFVYHYFTGDEGDSILLAALYSVAAFVLARSGDVRRGDRRQVADRRPNESRAGFRCGASTYFRWWLAGMFCELPPVDLLTGTPLLVWYLRALGARIGRDVLIDSIDLAGARSADDRVGRQRGHGGAHRERAGRTRRTGARAGASGTRRGGRLATPSWKTTRPWAPARGWADCRRWPPAGACRTARSGKVAGAARWIEPWNRLPPRPQVGRMASDWRRVRSSPSAGTGGGRAVLHDRLPQLHADRLDGRAPVGPVRERSASALRLRGCSSCWAFRPAWVLVLATVLLAAGLRRLFLRRQEAGLSSVL